MSAITDMIDPQKRLQLVEMRLLFFGAPTLRQHYTGLLRDLNEERRRLRVIIEHQANQGRGVR